MKTLWAVEARDCRRARNRRGHVETHATRSLARAHAERIRTPGLLEARVVAYRREGWSPPADPALVGDVIRVRKHEESA